jgi:hypothetical protein
VSVPEGRISFLLKMMTVVVVMMMMVLKEIT